MNKFTTREGTVWLVLVALSVFGFYNSTMDRTDVAYVVLAIGLGKFFLIFFEFMEMRHAHRGWKISMVLFMTMIFGAISFSL